MTRLTARFDQATALGIHATPTIEEGYFGANTLAIRISVKPIRKWHKVTKNRPTRDGVLVPVGQVQFGLGGTELWQRLAPLRDGPETRSGLIPVRPELVAPIRYFGPLPHGLDQGRRAAVGRLKSELLKRRAEHVRVKNCGNDRERCEAKQ